DAFFDAFFLEALAGFLEVFFLDAPRERAPVVALEDFRFVDFVLTVLTTLAFYAIARSSCKPRAPPRGRSGDRLR
ncbi:MAG: hypothetical protein KC468_25955, partial [Myxococcales bacterium]|nr:hypothetical protein [Myxococcales bacterium]